MAQDQVSAFSFYKHIRSYLSENISLADAKARICIYAAIAFLAIFLALDIFYFRQSYAVYSTFQIIYWIATMLVIFITMFAGLMVLYPQTVPVKKGFIYWGSSLNFSIDEYKDELRLLSRDEILNEVAVVNYNLGVINKRKFKWYKWASNACLIAFVLISLSTLVFS